jgi:uncharacterized protein YjbI with pentapeptide repeats
VANNRIKIGSSENYGALCGTSFHQANLSNADFIGAILKNTDLRAKFLTRACFNSAIKLNLAIAEKTLLFQPVIRDLLINYSMGYKKDYFKADLRRANLNGANLSHANLRQADLSHASLLYAALSHANLTQLKKIAEAAKTPDDSNLQKKAKTAVSFLEIIAKGLEPATKLAQACRNILPVIIGILGL